MRINVFGLGYVGCVSAACLARAGHEVNGVDIDPLKLEMIRSGRSPIIEPGLEAIINEAIRCGRLTPADVARPADVSLICVGTPSNPNGSASLEYVERVSQQIGRLLRTSNDFHVVCVRSTVPPGTVEEFVVPILESGSGRRLGRDFGVCMNPEFMREGSSIRDYYDPSMIVIGESDAPSGERIASLYRDIEAPVVRTSLRSAEMVKYVSNAFHALKVSFANEIGNLSTQLGVNGHEVMEIFCRDRTLNLSAAYLKPGFAFGGSCLPKDVRALNHEVRKHGLTSPVLASILPSNQNQIETAFNAIRTFGKKKVGMLGLSFKSGSDDLRESPMVELAERLLGKGYELMIYDRDVEMARIFGANKQYIEQAIPHVSVLMRASLEEVVGHSEVVIIAKNDVEFLTAIASLPDGKIIFDLVGAVDDRGRRRDERGRHDGHRQPRVPDAIAES